MRRSLDAERNRRGRRANNEVARTVFFTIACNICDNQCSRSQLHIWQLFVINMRQCACKNYCIVGGATPPCAAAPSPRPCNTIPQEAEIFFSPDGHPSAGLAGRAWTRLEAPLQNTTLCIVLVDKRSNCVHNDACLLLVTFTRTELWHCTCIISKPVRKVDSPYPAVGMDLNLEFSVFWTIFSPDFD